MIKSIKIRLLPTDTQNILMFKSTGIARFTYNWGLNRWNEMFKEDLNINIFCVSVGNNLIFIDLIMFSPP